MTLRHAYRGPLNAGSAEDMINLPGIEDNNTSRHNHGKPFPLEMDHQQTFRDMVSLVDVTCSCMGYT